jgi:carbamoyl-phosphate synthase small subunit
VEITSQNHGFVVTRESLPGQNGKDGEFGGVSETHHSLFDSSLEGIRADAKRAFSVQYHPEASPGPRDSHYLFRRFTEMMAAG